MPAATDRAGKIEFGKSSIVDTVMYRNVLRSTRWPVAYLLKLTFSQSRKLQQCGATGQPPDHPHPHLQVPAINAALGTVDN